MIISVSINCYGQKDIWSLREFELHIKIKNNYKLLVSVINWRIFVYEKHVCNNLYDNEAYNDKGLIAFIVIE